MNIKRDTLAKLVNNAFDMTIALEQFLDEMSDPTNHEQMHQWTQLAKLVYATRETIYRAQQALDETPPWKD